MAKGSCPEKGAADKEKCPQAQPLIARSVMAIMMVDYFHNCRQADHSVKYTP